MQELKKKSLSEITATQPIKPKKDWKYEHWVIYGDYAY